MIMLPKEWRRRIKKLPKGLTLRESATRLGANYYTARIWLIRLKYRFSDERKFPRSESYRMKLATVNPREVDWSKSNADIARQHGVSRERIRQLRNAHEAQTELAA